MNQQQRPMNNIRGCKMATITKGTMLLMMVSSSYVLPINTISVSAKPSSPTPSFVSHRHALVNRGHDHQPQLWRSLRRSAVTDSRGGESFDGSPSYSSDDDNNNSHSKTTTTATMPPTFAPTPSTSSIQDDKKLLSSTSPSSAPVMTPTSMATGVVSSSPAPTSAVSESTSSTDDATVTTASHGYSDCSNRLDYNVSTIDPSSILIEDLLTTLQTRIDTGLSEEQVESRLEQYGLNVLPKTKGNSILQLILEQFEDRLVQILLFVALLSAIFSTVELLQGGNSGGSGGASAAATAEVVKETLTTSEILHAFVEPAVIIAILILNAAVGVWQSYSASDSLESLTKLQPTLCNVLRRKSEGDGEDDISTSSSQWLSEYPASQLVPGDIIELRVGDKIPADSRLLKISGASMNIDESCLTGESVTVSKLPGNEGTTTKTIDDSSTSSSILQDQIGMLFSGTMITSGNGIAVVVQTGTATQFGKIQQSVSEASTDTDISKKTPLGLKLDEFGDTLTLLIGLICIAVWIISIPKFNDSSFPTVWDGAIYYAKVSVALGVAAIPEGLPAVITLCLSLGTRKMAQRNVLVRKLPSVETLGCTTVICTDKTGTLTTNEMTAISLVTFEKSQNKVKDYHDEIVEHTIEGTSYTPIGKIDGIEKDIEITIQNPNGSIRDIAAISALCNNAKIIGIDVVENEEDGNSSRTNKASSSPTEKSYIRAGEPTEAALCLLAEKIGGLAESSSLASDGNDLRPSTIASANVDIWRNTYTRHATLEFNRDRKSMSVLCSNDGSKANQLLVKGAPNLLLERCTHIKYRGGRVVKMTGSMRRAIQNKFKQLDKRPLRCLALAIKTKEMGLESSLVEFQPLPEDDNAAANHLLLKDPSKYSDIESGLTLVGIVGIKDPARPEVASSIKECTMAGIRVMMITGDARDTAIAIARDVNIFSKDPEIPIKAYEGREFFLKSESEQLDILKEGNIVFCRAEPADKRKLIKMLQGPRLNEIVAMTGDGVNDASALQQASIGVAMGITGTEVAKDASDMILADDNFKTIVAAVEEGRRIYANMQAFICFLISCNIGEICAIFIATLLGFPEPLTAMHLLWVNLVTDGPPATALGFNPPAPNLMEVPPRPTNEPIMTKWLLTRYCITGLYVGIATICIFAQHYLDLGVSVRELSNWSQCGTFWTPVNQNDGTVGLTCTELFQGTHRELPQTLALTTLVCMEMLKALSAVSVDSSLLTVGPQNNIWLLLGVTGPFLLHLVVVYSSQLGIPWLGESFGIVSLNFDNWINILSWSMPILLVDEILKAIGRYLAARKERQATATN